MDNEALTPQPVKRIRLLDIPLDIVPKESLAQTVYGLLGMGAVPRPSSSGRPVSPLQREARNLILLSCSDLLKARRNSEYRAFVSGAALIIPISKSLVSGTRFLLDKTPQRYMPFRFVVELLAILEQQELSVYLLGGRPRLMSIVERNIRKTYPHLRVVGKHTAPRKPREEAAVIEAIRKASPALLLVGRGVRGGELWIARHSARLGGGLRLWCSDLFSVFAERRSRPADKTFDLGLEWAGLLLRNPLRVFRIFPYLYYKALLLFHKLFRQQPAGRPPGGFSPVTRVSEN
ncbi:MAG: WecB/TagA/CpsF family glycosyltransferase [Treponematales bacterium]